jgi:hypothetical protein
MSYLEGLFVILDIVTINVVVGANGLSKLGSNYHTRPLRGRATSKHHDSTTGVLEGRLQQPNSNAKGHAGTPKASPITRNGPRVFLQLL